MTTLRTAALAALTACAVSLAGAATASASASAQEATPMTKRLAITGTNRGKDFTGTYTIRRFTSSGGQLQAVGTLTGTLKNRRVSRSGVRIPATLTRRAAAAQIPPSPNACTILDLALGPIDLNLLGLRVRTNEILVLIEGVRGPGNLLGNLLCGITGILDPQGQSARTLAPALNSIIALVPRSA